MKTKLYSFFVTFSLFLILAYVVELLLDAGAFKKIELIHFQQCRKSPLIYGPEDMALIQGTHWVIISSDARTPPKKGDLLLYDYSQNEVISVNRNKFPKDFNPHGLDIIKDGTNFLIAVINQVNEDHTQIEIFELNPQLRTLTRLRHIQNENLLAANDIVVISNNEFFYTRDSNTKDPHLLKVQQYLRQPTGSVWHYQNEKFKEVITGLFYANGIIFDLPTSTLYISEMLGRKINSYHWDHLKANVKNTIKVPHGIDNLTLKDNFIYGAGHPKLFDLKKMRDDRNFKSPSVILEIDKNLTNYKTIYEDNGDDIAASSVALQVSKNEILVGSVFDDHLLNCVISPQTKSY